MKTIKVPKIEFESKISEINSWTIIHLPKSASAKLPSRGMTLVDIKINNYQFKAPLEPDGKGSHWINLDKKILKASKADVGDNVKLEISQTKDWIEPSIPEDLKTALSSSPEANKVWKDTTPMARWDWIRWINSTKEIETRKKRIKVGISKLKSGTKRPCCFNRSMCTEPSVSNKGILIEPKQ